MGKTMERILLGVVLCLGFVGSLVSINLVAPIEQSDNTARYCWSDPANNGQRSCGTAEVIPENAFNIREDRR